MADTSITAACGFVVPRYRWWQGPFYGIGLKLYDALAGDLKSAVTEFKTTYR